jgi:hypothetical protein
MIQRQLAAAMASAMRSASEFLAGAVGAADLAVCRARDCTNNPLEATRYQARISADRAADDLSAKDMQTFLGVYILRYNHPNTGQHAFHYDSGLGF